MKWVHVAVKFSFGKLINNLQCACLLNTETLMFWCPKSPKEWSALQYG